MEPTNQNQLVQESEAEALEAFRGPEFFEEEELEQEGEGQEPKEEDLSPEDRSARHFQSLYDKSQAELEAIKQQMQVQQQYLQHLYLQQQGGQQPSGGQPQVNPNSAVRESATSPQKPERPVRPQNYDPIDATSDPSSASWRYREQLEEYMEGMGDYLGTVEENAMRRAQAIAEQQAQQMRAATIRQQLSNGYGMTEDEINDFWQIMDDPNMVTVENLVKFYRSLKGTPAQPMRRQSKIPVPPVPPSTRTGKTQDTRSPEDRIMDDMISQFKGTQFNE